MEMVEESVVESKDLKAGMSVELEFNLWIKENMEEIRNRLLTWNEEYEDEYYDLASTITLIASKFFLQEKGLPFSQEIDAGFGTIIHACDLFS